MSRSGLRNLFLVLFSAGCLGFTAWVGYALLFGSDTFRTPIGGAFSLRDPTGQTVSDQDLQGRFPLIYFGYTYCPDVCPSTLSDMTRALEAFEVTAPERATKVAPIFISVDPSRDDEKILSAYARHFHPRLLALTGSEAEIAEAAKAYQVFYRKVPVEEGAETAEGDYLLDHTSYVYLMGPEGDYLTHFAKDADAEVIARGLETYVN